MRFRSLLFCGILLKATVGFGMCQWFFIGLANYPHTKQRYDFNCGAACLNSSFVRHARFTPGDIALWHELGMIGRTYPIADHNEVLAIRARTRGLHARVQRNLTLWDLWRFQQADEDVILQWYFEDSWHFSSLTGMSAIRTPQFGWQYMGVRMMDPWLYDSEIWRPVSYFLPNWSGVGVRISSRPLIN